MELKLKLELVMHVRIHLQVGIRHSPENAKGHGKEMYRKHYIKFIDTFCRAVHLPQSGCSYANVVKVLHCA